MAAQNNIKAGAGGSYRAAQPSVGAGGIWRAAKAAWVGVGGVWQQAYTAIAALTASAAPAVGVSSGNTATITSSVRTCTPAGGVAPYSYLWSLVSSTAPSPGIVSPTAPGTAFTSAGMNSGETFSAVAKCTVTDNAGTVVDSNTITINWSRN